MLSAILSFLGGSVFRMIWGELSAAWSKSQDHRHEMERMELQAELEAAQHARNLEAIRVQAELGVKTIQVQAEANISEVEAQGWLEAVKATTGAKSGMGWVDAWNAVIRPAVASWAVLMITGNYAGWWALDDHGWSLAGAALGIYLADRALFKRNK